MNDILKTYMERFRENRHTLRRYTAFVLALAMITTLFVNWQLHGVGISMTAQYQCGEEEHIHTADCYTKVLTCGYEEGELENADELAAAAATSQPTVEAEPAPLALEPQIEFVPHEHTEDCYTEVQTLTCMEEEHVHGDDCFDPEDGTLICEKFEHTHDENCYTTEYELTCGLEEGELVEQVVEPTQSAELAAMAVAEPVALEPTVDTVEPIYHHHTDACYEEVLTCPLPEHHHTVACLSDTSADVETPEEWQAANDKAVMTGNWDEDLLSVAKTQLGYEQSEKNFEIDPADGVTLRYYSRYGQSYGNPYGEWDVMFLSYCLKYAGIPQSAIPQEASVLALRSSMSDMDWLLDGEDGSTANVGDIVIYNKYVTRTVAVDSSADGAADGLDDQFSMDAEGENGAELETSGAAALDAAPAAEDAPTADSVITPDLPDTANPEQPAAKPVDSTDTTASETSAPSVVSPAAEPQTTTVTDAQPVETVGIVSEADENTLTVISGDVDGKVAEVTLSNAEVLAVVDVAAAQYADEMLSSAVDGALKAPSMLTLAGVEDTTASTSTTYLDFFDETKDKGNGGITGIMVKQDTKVLKPGDPITLKDGDKLSLTYYFNIPEKALLGLSNRTLTYHLPKGIQLEKKKDFNLIDKTTNTKVGTGVIQTDGTVLLTFDNSFDIEKPFTGQFDFQAKASAVSSGEDTKIHFPTKLDLIVKLPRDLTTQKTCAAPFVGEDGFTYIDYTFTVSSNNGWNEKIEILDELQNNTTIAGEYVKDKFKLYKTGQTDPITDYKNNFTTTNGKPSFHITDLDPLKAGESYKLTYRVKMTKNDVTDVSEVEFKNKAWSNDKKERSTTTKFENRISKTGSYDADTDKIKWTVTVKNPYGQNLQGSKVVDTITEGGAKIEGNVTLAQTRSPDGSYIYKLIKDDIAPNKDRTGFTYTFNDADADEGYQFTGKEYTFTYVTSAPRDANGNFKKVHNDSNITIDKKTYTAGKDVTPSDRRLEIRKDPTGSFTSTGENQYTAGWKLSSDVPNYWKTYDYLDRIKDSENVTHYGIALELDKEIRDHLRFKNANNETLTAEQAGITVTIDYYADDIDNLKYADPSKKLDVTDNKTPVHAFIIHLENTGKYNGTSPVKSMSVSSYYTHVDTTKVKAGSEVRIYNNDKSYYYKKNLDKTSLTKGVSKNDSDTSPYYGSASTNYKPTATENYKSGMKVYYELVLDITSWSKFPEDGTVTVTDTLQDGLTFKDGSAKGFFGWGNWCQQNSSDTGFTFASTSNFEATCKGQTITFKFKNLNDPKAQHEIVDKNDAKRATHLLVRYAATVTDPKWDNPKTTTGTYTNTAKWDGNEAEATITLNRSLEYLTKSATAEALADEGKLVVHYSLNINPAGADLLEGGNTVTLTDTMAVQAKNVTAHLDMDSVKLYDYPYKKDSTPLETTSYGMVYERTTDSGKDTHTMKFTLDDARGYVLKYDYVLDSNDKVTLSNTAELTGDHHAKEETKTKILDAHGSVSSSMFTLYKVDSLNSSTRLQGATFNLSYYDGTKFVNHEGQSVHITDEKGEIVLHLGDNLKDDQSGGLFNIKTDTLYKLVETAPPAGYKMGTPDETTVYVIFAITEGQTADEAWENTAHPKDLDQSKVVIVTGGQQKNYDVKNTRTWLTIQKFWQDKDGLTIEGDKAPETEVTVYLYRKDKDGNKDSNFKETITLNKNNKWTYVYKKVDDDYFYYIEEASTGGKYDVTYSDSNTTGVEKGGLLTLTNKEIVGYELPSTGGTGTLPYTAVGGTMMLSALAYSFIHRKRRREGRADD